MNKKIETSKRSAAFVHLKDFCTFSIGKDDDFLEVTEWTNGEGYDIHIGNSEGDKQIQLSWGQLDAIFQCIKELGCDFGEEEEEKFISTNSGLVSLDEHNSNAWSTQTGWFSNEPKPNGIACPRCGNQLMDTNPMITLTSYPAKKDVHCPKCEYKGYRIA